MADAMHLTVDTGAVTIDVLDKDGSKLGELKFNPTDSRIPIRYEEVVAHFNAMEIPEDMDADAIKRMESDISEQIDYLLGYRVAETLFSICGPMTVVGSGDFFFQECLDGIGNLVSDFMKKRVNAKLKRVQKATAKYEKK